MKLANFEKIAQRLETVALRIERQEWTEFVESRADTKTMLKKSFLSGLSRGLGMAVGFTILGAFVLYLLRIAAEANLPFIGELVADIVRIVETKLK